MTATNAEPYVLRRATPSDAAALSALATRMFTATFGAIFTDDDLLPFLATAYDVDRVRSEIEDPKRVVLLVFPPDDLTAPCGYSMLHDGSLRPGDEDKNPADYMELKRIYVDEAHHGHGAARLLMDQMMAIIRERNRPITWVGAWYKSFRAHSFYKKHGFVETGARMFPVGKTQNPSIVFTLDALDAPLKPPHV